MNRLSRLIAATGALALVVGLAACGPQDPATEAYLNGENAGYISSDGAIEEIAVADRGEPIVFSGTDENGETIDSADLVGQVVVANFWFAACGPCRVEAPHLEQVWQDHKAEGVQFVGINTSDEVDTAKAFAAEYGITYPSIITVKGSDAKLAFQKTIPLTGMPVTVVLDKEGRAAARIFGMVDSPSILSTLVKDALAEGT